MHHSCRFAIATKLVDYDRMDGWIQRGNYVFVVGWEREMVEREKIHTRERTGAARSSQWCLGNLGQLGKLSGKT